MSDDYYAPHPRLALDQHLVLVGHPGSGASQVARVVAGRTGLVLSDVERSAESAAGAARARVLVEQGPTRLQQLEAAALEKALRRRPCGLVALESGLLEQDDRRAWLLERARVVYLRRPPEALLRRIQQQLARSPGSLPEFLLGAPRDVDELCAHLAAREAALLDVPVIVDAGDDPPARIAASLLESLDQLLDVQRID